METAIIMSLLALMACMASIKLAFSSSKRSMELRRRFGAEYERVLLRHGKSEAERRFSMAERRVKNYGIRPLTGPEVAYFRHHWARIRRRCAEQPIHALHDAHRLVNTLLRTRGYYPSPWPRRIEDLAVHHPELVSVYRAARRVTKRAERGAVDAAQLRGALAQYERLLDCLLVTCETPASRPATHARLPHASLP